VIVSTDSCLFRDAKLGWFCNGGSYPSNNTLPHIKADGVVNFPLQPSQHICSAFLLRILFRCNLSQRLFLL
jgi:hypothetical protein